MSKIEVNTIEPQSGTDVTIGASGDTITVPSGATLNVNGTLGNSLNMTPVSHAYLSSDQSVTDNVSTTVQFDTVVYDPDNAYSTSTYRFTPQIAGRYLILADVAVQSNNYDIYYGQSQIRKNNSYTGAVRGGVFNNSVALIFSTFQAALFDMNGTTDYIIMKGAVSSHSGSATLTFDADTRGSTYFMAFRIIE